MISHEVFKRARILRRINQILTVPLNYTGNLRTKSHYNNFAMDKAYLRHVQDSTDVHINFRFVHETLKIDREFQFCRKINEDLDAAFSRIQANVMKEVNKRNKKARITPTVVVKLLYSDQSQQCFPKNFSELLNETCCALSTLSLVVMHQTFKMVLNTPWVCNLALPTLVLAGFPVYLCRKELQFADEGCSQYDWAKTKDQKNASWIHCGDGFFYETSEADIGFHIKCKVTPGNASGEFGPPMEVIVKDPVKAGPGTCPFERRHHFTSQSLSGDVFRVVSYNLLADLYADSTFSRTNLFSYCPPDALKISYRKQLFLKELIGYHADIVCLQEVDMSIFERTLTPVLQKYGYAGLMAMKGTCGEGVATFYRTDRFEVISTHELNMGKGIADQFELASLWNKIKDNTKLIQRMSKLSTTLQLIVLRGKDNDRLVVLANTHLYFHPDADHIRLLQIGFAMLYIDHIYKQTLSQQQLKDERQAAVLFCGDFNSTPECGIFQLMTEKHVPETLVDWCSNVEEAVERVALEQPFKMASACGTPKYTNYTQSFAACLDYIFYQCDRMSITQVVPLPTDEELKEHIAIPSICFPSDHVALVADLKFHPLK